MIPRSPSTLSSFQAEAEIDLNQRVASALPVAQVSNTEKVPESSLSKFAEIQSQMLTSIDSAKVQEAIFPSAVRALLGVKEFIDLDERNAWNIPRNKCFERLHYRNSIFYALQAKNLSLCLKMHLAKIMTLQQEKNVVGKTQAELLSAKTVLTRFFKSEKFYHALLNRMSNENSNLPFKGEGYSQQIRANSRIRTIRDTMEVTSEKYNSFLTEKEIKPEAVQAKLFSFVASDLFLDVASSSFNKLDQASLKARLQELLQEESQIPNKLLAPEARVTEIVSDGSMTLAPIPLHLEFKQDRRSPSAEFSSSLKNVTDPTEHRAKFFEFLLTNWEPELKYDENLTLSFHMAKNKQRPNYKKQCVILLERCLHKRLKNSAIALIKHILRIKGEQLELDKAQGNKLKQSETYMANKKISTSIGYIKTVIDYDYKYNFTDYRIRLDALQKLSPDELMQAAEKLNKMRTNARKSAARELREINLILPINLPYINQVLHLLREKTEFDSQDVLNLAKFYAKKERELQIPASRAAPSADSLSPLKASSAQPIYSQAPSHLQEPVAKKRRVIDNSIAEEPKTVSTVSPEALSALQKMISEIPPPKVEITKTQGTSDFFAKACTSQQVVFAEPKLTTVNETKIEYSYFDELWRQLNLLQAIQGSDVQSNLMLQQPINTLSHSQPSRSAAEVGVLNFASVTSSTAQERAVDVKEGEVTNANNATAQHDD